LKQVDKILLADTAIILILRFVAARDIVDLGAVGVYPK
jgi:hypothetical protein